MVNHGVGRSGSVLIYSAAEGTWCDCSSVRMRVDFEVLGSCSVGSCMLGSYNRFGFFQDPLS